MVTDYCPTCPCRKRSVPVCVYLVRTTRHTHIVQQQPDTRTKARKKTKLYAYNNGCIRGQYTPHVACCVVIGQEMPPPSPHSSASRERERSSCHCLLLSRFLSLLVIRGRILKEIVVVVVIACYCCCCRSVGPPLSPPKLKVNLVSLPLTYCFLIYFPPPRAHSSGNASMHVMYEKALGVHLFPVIAAKGNNNNKALSLSASRISARQ